jgi:hemerythrin-like domain-containing protein
MKMDALTLVRRDHERLEALLERILRGAGGTAEAGAVPLDELRAALRHHVDQEESILYPIFRERARRAEVDLAPLDRAVEQHRLIDRLARELLDTGPDGDGVRAKLTVLVEQVRTHLDAEDAVLLTAIEDLMDDDSLLELGRRMEQRDRVIAARQELARAVIPGGRRLAAFLGGLGAAAAGLLVLARRRRAPRRWRSPGRRRRG